MIAMPSIFSQLEQAAPRQRPAFIPRIPSMAEQIRAAADEATLRLYVMAPPKRATNKARAASAERLRHLCLRALAESDTVTIALLLERYPDVTVQSWSWVVRTLIQRGLAERVETRLRTLRIRITDAGREAAADLTQEQQ
ncbi:hypothetical protein CJ010_00655 [Azoarcus sp. DD4]|uniref:hypothetical protein n=1 Tax=Azoarcus sp. DD4 TaxID=2027405 RepID=UPI0011262BF5|nr:hypothetical protein [Azoarcus sp. DD4]QDF95166.1 hypothetical protein CJ010_00655 [Azoarcus sp. DD4]